MPGIRLNLTLSLHNQGVLEQEHVALVAVEAEELISPLQNMESLTTSSSSREEVSTCSV